MECPQKSGKPNTFLLLQVWCFLLTVSLVVMATLLASVKTKSAQVGAAPVPPPGQNSGSSSGSSASFIQLIKSESQDGLSWEESQACKSCCLVRDQDSVLCTEDGLYFVYAQVTFRGQPDQNRSKTAVLRRSTGTDQPPRTLAEGTFSNRTEGTVWLAKIVRLTAGDRISLRLRDEVLNDNTYWGAVRLQ
uniref:THD domain-containing protein n=1 Tax=Salarias fasciatus TaxID=181472 RepID=A0A672GL89_SALFA